MTTELSPLDIARQDLKLCEVPVETVDKFKSIETFLNTTCSKLSMLEITGFAKGEVKEHFKITNRLDILPIISAVKKSRKTHALIKAQRTDADKKPNVPALAAIDIMADMIIKCPRDTKNLMYYEDGMFHAGGDDKVQTIMLEGDTDFTPKNFDDTVKHIQAGTFVDRNDMNKVLNLNNGVLDYNTMEFSKHDPKYLCTTKLPVNYDEDATCPMFEKFLSEVVDDPEDLKYLLGYLFVNHTNFDVAFDLLGHGSDGKSVYIDTLELLFSEDDKRSIPLHSFTADQWAPGELYGVRLNTCGDIDGGIITMSSNLKSLISGDTISAPVKYAKSRINFRPKTKFVFAMNSLPRTVDHSDGFYRRFKIILFPNQYKGDEIDFDLRNKLETELSGILNLALKYRQKIVDGEHAIRPSTPEDYELYSNPLAVFLQDNVHNTYSCTNEVAVFNAFKRFTAYHRIPERLDINSVRRMMIKQGYKLTRMENMTAWNFVELDANPKYTTSATTKDASLGTFK